MSNKYKITIVQRDGGGQTSDDYHATVTRLSDGKQLIFIAEWKWWLKNVKLHPRRIATAFKQRDARDKKLAEVEEFTQ